MANYDAFVSYSHAKDKPIAAALQSIVQGLGKPWYRRRALRIFRDDTSLSATPSLWPSIEQALTQSRYLVLMASPEAAGSYWVNKEIAFWLEHKGADTILIALTAGDLAWDNTTGDFDRREAVPLPPALTGCFAGEPKWIDLRPYRDGADSGDSRFVEASADIAAAIHGMPKEDLLSQEVRQQRRALRLAWSAVGTLAVLMALAGWQWWEADSAKKVAVAAESVANEQKGIAQKQRDRAEFNFGIAQKAGDDVLLGLAQELRGADNMSVRSRRHILDIAQQLMDRLTEAAPEDLDVQRRRAVMLHEFASTYLAGGDLVAAGEAAEEMLRITRRLLEADPHNAFGLGGAAPDRRRAGLRKLDLSTSLNLVSDVRLAAGDLTAARAAAEASLALGRELLAADPDHLVLQSALAGKLGQAGRLRLMAGDVAGAEALYEENVAISRKLVEAHPNNVDYQSNLANAFHKLGEVRSAKGDRAGALDAVEDSLFITRQLVKFDSSNSRWQSDVGQALAWIGRLRAEGGDSTAALAAYQEGLAIYRRLAGVDARNTLWQKYLSQLLALVGDVQFDDHREAAVVAFGEALAIMRKLVAADPTNTEWQYDLSARLDRVGQARMAENQYAEALAVYQESLALTRKLVEFDASNVDLQRDLSISYEKVGNARFALGQYTGAVAAYEDSLAVIRRVVNAIPNNATWRHRLRLSLQRTGDLLRAGSEGARALAAYREASEIMRDLVASNPQHAGWLDGLSSSLEKLGDLQADSGDTGAALAAYEESLAIRRKLLVGEADGSERQINFVLGLYNVSTVADPLRRQAALSEALAISEVLARTGKLPSGRADWPELFKSLLAAPLPQRGRAK